jgi:uncharacterized DUF497 family protein
MKHASARLPGGWGCRFDRLAAGARRAIRELATLWRELSTILSTYRIGSIDHIDCAYNYMYTGAVAFEWDPNKASANVRKHWVQFSEAVGVFSDDYAITINDNESDPDAQRFLTLGMGIKGRILVVVYCYSGKNIRIISARTAGRPERDQYEAQR